MYDPSRFYEIFPITYVLWTSYSENKVDFFELKWLDPEQLLYVIHGKIVFDLDLIILFLKICLAISKFNIFGEIGRTRDRKSVV